MTGYRKLLIGVLGLGAAVAAAALGRLEGAELAAVLIGVVTAVAGGNAIEHLARRRGGEG